MRRLHRRYAMIEIAKGQRRRLRLKITTLQSITTEICGRKVDPVLQAYLPDYISELTGLLEFIHKDSLAIPLDLEPVFSLSTTKLS